MPTIREMALRYYDNRESVEACQAFFEDPTDADKMERAFNSVLPILGIIVRKEFRSIDDFSHDDLIQVGAIEYWRLLDNPNKKPRPYDPKSHLNLYYKVGLRAMLKIRNQLESEVGNFHENNAVPFTATCNFRNPEARVFAKEIPVLVYERVVEKITANGRFTGDEFKVCDYIAQCMVFETPIIHHELRTLGGKLSTVEFFERYIDTLRRQVYHELRDEVNIHSMLGDEGAALDPKYYVPWETDACAKV